MRRRRPGPRPANAQPPTATATTTATAHRPTAATVARLDEYRARRHDRDAAAAAYLHLAARGLVDPDTWRVYLRQDGPRRWGWPA